VDAQTSKDQGDITKYTEFEFTDLKISWNDVRHDERKTKKTKPSKIRI